MNTSIITHHSVEFLRKGRSKPEHGIFRLEVPIELREVSRKQLVPAFIRQLPETEDVILHGFEGRLWRPVEAKTSEEHRRDPMYRAEASLTESGGLLIGWAVHRPLGAAVNRFNRALSPETLPSFTEAASAKDGIGSGAKIISEDTEVRVRAAKDAGRKVLKIGRELWIQVRDPMLFVRKLNPGNRYDTKLLVDIHSDFGWWKLDGMLFRADRAAEAAMWPSVAAGKPVSALAPSRNAPGQALASYGVTKFDPAFFSDDDLVEFAKDHLADACTPVIEAMSPRLRQTWQQLRTYREVLDVEGTRSAAEASLSHVPEMLQMLLEVRDIPIDDRMRLVRSISRLEADQRRVTEIERITAPRLPAETDDALEDLDLGVLAP